MDLNHTFGEGAANWLRPVFNNRDVSKIVQTIFTAAAMSLFILSTTASSAPAAVDTPDYTYQVWDGLGAGEPVIVRVPVVVSISPESQFAAIFMPTRPLQLTQTPVEEINLAVLCGFTQRSELQPANTYLVVIDASKAQWPWGVSPRELEAVAAMIVQCAEKVAHEQLKRFAPGQNHRIVIRLEWGQNDARNREMTITRTH